MTSIPIRCLCWIRNYLIYPLVVLSLMLASCVDTNGLSVRSSRVPHPNSNANASIIVTEYADLQCPACSTVHKRVVKPLLTQYGDRIRYEFRHFPLQSIHRYAVLAAQASECAADQGKFWEYVDLAYNHQNDLDNKALHAWAEELHLAMELFDRCVRSGIKKRTVFDDYNEGRRMGITKTPTFLVDGEKVSQDLTTLEATIQIATQASSKQH